MKTVSIVGVGKAGGALAIALSGAGYKIENLFHRNIRIANKIKRAEVPTARLAKWPDVGAISSDVVIIAVPDPEIGAVSTELETNVVSGQVVLHTSGSLPSKVLSNLTRLGCSIGSLHPLVSISDPFQGATEFEAAYFCIEGDKRAVAEARLIVKILGGKPFALPASKKALYHAAAVTSAGHVIALFDAAVEMLSECGLTKRQSAKVLFPLIQSAVANLKERSTEDALTGSFARLDVAAFERHLASFGPVPEPIKELYLALGERSLDMVERRDGPGKRLADFRTRISVAKRKTK